MENALTVGLSQQVVLRRAMNVAANNIANMNTTGFKAEKLSFQEYLQPFETNEGKEALALVWDVASHRDFSAGSLTQTGAPLDFAIDGEAFFAVQTPDGVQYTRNGHFGLDENGQLVTRGGFPVLDDGGAPILIDPDLGPVSVGNDGVIAQGDNQVGAFGLNAFQTPQGLLRVGDGLFQTDEAPIPPTRVAIRQGFLEGSNVEPIRAVTNMIEISRAYQSAAKLIETADELARQAVQKLSE